MAISKPVSKRKASGNASRTPKVSSEERYSLIAEAAYYRAEKRDFQNGDPVEDWLAAEAEIDGKLLNIA